MLANDRPYTFDRVFRLFVTLVFTVGFVWLAGYLSEALLPFLAALLLAYLLNPLVNRVQRKIPSRGLAVLASLLLLVFVMISLFLVVVPVLGREFANAGHVIAGLVTDSPLATKVRGYLSPDLWKEVRSIVDSPEVREYLQGDGAMKIAKTIASKFFPGVWGVLSGAAGLLSALVGLFVVALYLVFLLMDFKKVESTWQAYLPPASRNSIVEFTSDFSMYMNRYFRAQALVAGIVGILFATGFWLIGIPLGIPLGLLVGLLNMVPYLQLLAIPPALFFGLIHALQTDGSVLGILLLVAGVFAIVQIIQDAILTPRIMGDVTGLSPAVILLSLSVWGKLLGLLGLLIAIPATCLILAYYQRYLRNAAQEAAQEPVT